MRFDRIPTCASTVTATLGLMACGGAHVAPTTSVATRTVSHVANAPRANAPLREATLVGHADWLNFLGATPEGDAYVMGGLRVRVHGDDIAIAADSPAGSISLATAVDHGWVFVTSDGAVLASDTFLGALRRLDDMPATLHAQFDGNSSMASRGRAALVTFDGALWTTDGSTVPTRVEGLSGRVIGAAFADAHHGVVVTDLATLFTRDGGQSFSPVDLQGPSATSVRAEGDVFLLRTTAGVRALTADGALRPGDPPSSSYHFADADTRRAVRDRVRAAIPRAAYQRSAVTANGLIAIDDEDVVRIDPTTGATTRLAAAPRHDCHMATWGGGVAAVCPGAPGAQVFYSETGEHFAPVTGFRSSGDPVFADDGPFAAGRGDCTAQPMVPTPGPRPPMTQICVTDRTSGQAHAIDLGSWPGSFGGIHAGVLLLTSHEGQHIERIDLESGQIAPVAIDSMPTDAFVLSPSWTPDGRIVALVSLAHDGGTRLALGRPGETLRTVPVPGRARIVRASTDGSLLLAGESAAQLWLADPEARAFQPVHVRVDGDPSNVRLPFGGYGSSVGCSDAGCWIGDVWLSSAADTSHPAPFAARRPYTLASFPLSHTPTSTFDCAGGAPAASPAPGRTTATSHEAPLELLGPGVRARVAIHSAHDHTTASVHWNAIDGHGGEIDRTSATTPWPAWTAGSDVSQAALRVVGASAHAVLIERCDHERTVTCDLVSVASGGAATRVEGLAALVPEAQGSLRVNYAMPLRDGGLLALVRSHVAMATVDVVMEIDPRGRIGRHRVVVASDPLRRDALALHGSEPGLMVWSARTTDAMHFVPIDPRVPTVDEALSTEAAIRACSGRPAADAWQLLGDETAVAPGLRYEHLVTASDHAAWVEAGATTRCVRATGRGLIGPYAPPPSDRNTRGYTLIARADGTLAGRSGDATDAAATTCSAPRAAVVSAQ